MDKELGPVNYADVVDQEYQTIKKYSEKTAELIDAKIKEYVNDCYDRAKKLIKEHKSLIEEMSLVLIEKEYITKEEFLEMTGLEGKK